MSLESLIVTPCILKMAWHFIISFPKMQAIYNIRKRIVLASEFGIFLRLRKRRQRLATLSEPFAGVSCPGTSCPAGATDLSLHSTKALPRQRPAHLIALRQLINFPQFEANFTGFTEYFTAIDLSQIAIK